jgi:prevent-host-death family protein
LNFDGLRLPQSRSTLDLAKFLADFLAMKISVNIGELKNRLSEFLDRVEKGDEIEVCKRNIPFATIAGMPARKNHSQPGWAKGSLRILQPVEGPAIPENDWNMLSDGFDPLK